MQETKKSGRKFFFVVGLILILVAGIFLYKDRSFLKQSIEVTGEVINVSTDISVDMHSNATFYYHPDIRFTTKEGQEVIFTSAASLSSQDYIAGKKVQVLYLPENPEKAKLKDASSSWIFVLGGIGVAVILMVGLIALFSRIDRKRILWLKQNGRHLKTKLKSIENLDRKNKQSSGPFVINSETTENGQQYIFRSDHIRFDPTPQLEKDQTIIVLVDPNHMRNYWMDTSFLKEEVKL